MDRQIIAIVFNEGGKLISELLRLRAPKIKVAQYPVEVAPPAEPREILEEPPKKKTVAGTACLPCVNNHFSVCSGLISDEALRMARRHGIGDEEINRINLCLDQLNGMEREDLAVDKIATLPQWEKDLAIYAQNESAGIRHKLETLKSVDDLEDVALQIKEARTKIGKEYFKSKLASIESRRENEQS